MNNNEQKNTSVQGHELNDDELNTVTGGFLDGLKPKNKDDIDMVLPQPAPTPAPPSNEGNWH